MFVRCATIALSVLSIISLTGNVFGNVRVMAQNPNIVTNVVYTNNTQILETFGNSLRNAINYYKTMLTAGHNRAIERQLQVIGYVCSKQLCVTSSNCTRKQIGILMIQCIQDVIAIRDPNELNRVYNLSKRLNFIETTHSNLQLLLFKTANITNLQNAKKFVKQVISADHSQGDIIRLMLAEKLYEREGTHQNSSAALLLNRLTNAIYNNRTRRFFLLENDEDWPEFFREFATDSPWYCFLAAVFGVKLMLMYGFHVRQLYMCCRGGNTNKNTKSFNAGGNNTNSSATLLRGKKRNTKFTADHFMDEYDLTGNGTMPIIHQANDQQHQHHDINMPITNRANKKPTTLAKLLNPKKFHPKRNNDASNYLDQHYRNHDDTEMITFADATAIRTPNIVAAAQTPYHQNV